MAAATVAPPQITFDEYLETSYRPDSDFLDDHLEERPMGEYEHNN